MFQPETEDMLPRSAPRPSAPLELGGNSAAAVIARPSVPEVSILYGAQQPQQPGTTKERSATASQQTYAAWKKQVLPKVSFPPAGAEVYSIDGHIVSSSVATTASRGNNTAQVCNGSMSVATMPSNIYPLRTMAVAAALPSSAASSYRRSLESTTTVYTPATTEELLKQRRSLDVTLSTPTPTYTNSHEVLTICAGTQTDATLSMSPSAQLNEMLENFATKADIEQLFTVVNAMRMEQLRFTQLCEALLIKHETAAAASTTTQYVHQCDASTQCNASPPPPPTTNEMPREAQYRPTAAVPNGYSEPTRQTQPYYQQLPNVVASPAAQSTAYQANTPRSSRTTPTTRGTTVQALPKPSTEKSIIMNELALKYIPNEKLNELLQELNIATGTPPAPLALPLRQIDNNLDKGPSDMSNASYKYLRKYRLLPDERAARDIDQEQQSPAGERPRMHSPLTARTRQQQSPYQQQHAGSPLILTEGTPRAGMLDLEHIRHQPKLL